MKEVELQPLKVNNYPFILKSVYSRSEPTSKYWARDTSANRDDSAQTAHT